jgi:predicted Fe-S protein YdhL (DUF1289 family)
MNDRILHFGIYKGRPINEVPDEYLNWVVTSHSDKRAINAAIFELDLRASKIINKKTKAKTKKRTGKKKREK